MMPKTPHFVPLETAMEDAVLHMLANGWTVAEIARYWGVSEKEIEDCR